MVNKENNDGDSEITDIKSSDSESTISDNIIVSNKNNNNNNKNENENQNENGRSDICINLTLFTTNTMHAKNQKHLHQTISIISTTRTKIENGVFQKQ